MESKSNSASSDMMRPNLASCFQWRKSTAGTFVGAVWRLDYCSFPLDGQRIRLISVPDRDSTRLSHLLEPLSFQPKTVKITVICRMMIWTTDTDAQMDGLILSSKHTLPCTSSLYSKVQKTKYNCAENPLQREQSSARWSVGLHCTLYQCRCRIYLAA